MDSGPAPVMSRRPPPGGFPGSTTGGCCARSAASRPPNTSGTGPKARHHDREGGGFAAAHPPGEAAAFQAGTRRARVRGRPLQPKRDCRRRTTSTDERCLVTVHAKSRLAWSLCRPRGQETRARPAGLPFPGARRVRCRVRGARMTAASVNRRSIFRKEQENCTKLLTGSSHGSRRRGALRPTLTPSWRPAWDIKRERFPGKTRKTARTAIRGKPSLYQTRGSAARQPIPRTGNSGRGLGDATREPRAGTGATDQPVPGATA